MSKKKKARLGSMMHGDAADKHWREREIGQGLKVLEVLHYHVLAINLMIEVREEWHRVREVKRR